MMENEDTFKQELLSLFMTIRKFHEKHNCLNTFFAIIDENKVLNCTSSFSSEHRIEFLHNLIDYIENSKNYTVRDQAIPKFNS